jgi:hypothetical protein
MAQPCLTTIKNSCPHSIVRRPLAAEMFDEDELEAFSRPILRTYQGRKGDVDTAYTTLKEAVVAFHAAPLNSNPRVIRANKTLAELDCKLMPVFCDGEAQRIHQEMFGGYILRTFAGFGNGDIETKHPTLESAVAAFAAAPTDSVPRLLQDGRTIADLDPEAGLTPTFWDDEAQRIYREVSD